MQMVTVIVANASRTVNIVKLGKVIRQLVSNGPYLSLRINVCQRNASWMRMVSARLLRKKPQCV